MRLLFARLASLILLTTIAHSASADTVYSDSRAIFGRIVSIDRAGIAIAPGCVGDRKDVLPWSEARGLIFDARCDAPQARIPSAGGGICSKQPSRRFLLHLVGQQRPIAADSLQLGQDNVVHFRDEERAIDGHAPRTSLRGISYGSVCPDDLAEAVLPADICVEPIGRAVNFSFDTPLENRVLTRGFAYHLEFGEPGMEQGRDATQLRELVRHGFATALTIWISELWRRREHYPSSMQAVLESFVSRGQTVVMVVPPQVVARQCPHVANFVVRIYTAETGPFSPGARAFAAFAQRPGRTIALNFGKYPCWENSYKPQIFNLGTQCVNIVPILIHELGHAFGLDHVDEEDSVMRDIVTVSRPSVRDIDRLSVQLQLAIDGGAPGLLQVGPVESAALPAAEAISIE